ncbi:MAG: helix-turn-helix domain-containing protein [Thermoleophilaceae bacterium]
MITNERQYRITKAELKKFEEALAEQRKRDAGEDVDPRIHAAMGGALKSEADELRRQLRAYEDLREGRVRSRTLQSLSELPTALIEARIASRVTQKTLAARLGVAEQQVQRWEATSYSGVSVGRVQEVADALGVRITKKVDFTPARRTSATTKRSTRRTDAEKDNAGKSARSSSPSSRGGRRTTKRKRPSTKA